MNKTVKMENGTVYEILDELGAGGQGKVFKAKNLTDSKVYALKVYTVDYPSVFYENIRRNILKGAPAKNFVWPKMLTEPLGKNKDRYGYVMDLYGREYSSFPKIILGKAQFASKEVQINALIELVSAFEALHAEGYSYQDLNDGGIVINTQTGDVLVCDNDNVAPYGYNLGIQGKFKYMAPEVAINAFKPDKHSDRFSLAVLLFYILCKGHPYDGVQRLSGQLTPALQEKIYGTEPVFIFHPTDKSNRPDPEVDKNPIKIWPLLPSFIQKCFIETFTKGMPKVGRELKEIELERQERTSEVEWKKALYLWLESMVTCPHCDCSITPEIDVNNRISMSRCPHCNKKLDLKLPVMEIIKNNKVVRKIILEEDKFVSTRSVTSIDSKDPAFVVERSKKVKNLLGIRNILNFGWKCSQPGSEDRVKQPGEVVPLLDQVMIEFDYDYSGKVYIK